MVDCIVFFESALELIPESLRNHPLVRKEWRQNVKKKNRGVLLDGAIHRSLLDLLDDSKRRGRPDIIHHSLISIMFSSLFKQNKLQVYIHTRNDLCIQIPSNWRIPVNYNRFSGLFSQLLLKRRVPLTGEPILIVERSSLKKLLQKFKDSEIFLCEVPSGSIETLQMIKNLTEISHSTSRIFLIGGYQYGDIELNLIRLFDGTYNVKILQLYDEVKPSWVIAAKLTHWLETVKVNERKSSNR